MVTGRVPPEVVILAGGVQELPIAEEVAEEGGLPVTRVMPGMLLPMEAVAGVVMPGPIHLTGIVPGVVPVTLVVPGEYTTVDLPVMDTRGQVACSRYMHIRLTTTALFQAMGVREVMPATLVPVAVAQGVEV